MHPKRVCDFVRPLPELLTKQVHIQVAKQASEPTCADNDGYFDSTVTVYGFMGIPDKQPIARALAPTLIHCAHTTGLSRWNSLKVKDSQGETLSGWHSQG